MGFLHLFKRPRLKSQELEDLDLPPAPPPLDKFAEEDHQEGYQDISAKEEFKSDEAVPEGIEPFELELPEFDESEIKEEIKEPKIGPKIEIRRQEAKQTKPEIILPPLPSLRQPTFEDKGVKRDVPIAVLPKHHERIKLPKSTYVKLNDLKNVLLDIKIIKSDLKSSQEIFVSFEDIGFKQDKTYQKLNADANELQKKLVYIDKSLFKGEKI